jgi:DNA-binding MarR family transcriptional regulator
MSDTFRKAYRKLTESEFEHVEQIKDEATRLEMLIKKGLHAEDHASFTDMRNQQRFIALAMTNLEQAVMWAVKAYT